MTSSTRSLKDFDKSLLELFQLSFCDNLCHQSNAIDAISNHESRPTNFDKSYLYQQKKASETDLF